MDNFENSFPEWGDELEWEEEEEKKLDKPRYYAGQSRLPRFSKYIVEIVDPKNTSPTPIKIIPAPDAQLEWYKPFEYEPKLLKDYLTVIIQLHKSLGENADKIIKKRKYLIDASFREKAKLDASLIIEFCEKYGLLSGDSEKILQETYTQEQHAIHNGPKVLEVSKSKFNELFKEEMEALSLPFNDWVLKWYRGLRSLRMLSKYSPMQPRTKKEQIKFYKMRNRFLRMHKVNSRGDNIGRWYDDEILKYISNWAEFRQKGFRPSEAYFNTEKKWKDMLSCLSVNTTISIDFDGINGKIDYVIKSLLDALKIVAINSVLGAREQIKLCALPECGKAFLTTDPRANYCCPKHSQRGRIRKYRAQKAATKSGEIIA